MLEIENLSSSGEKINYLTLLARNGGGGEVDTFPKNSARIAQDSSILIFPARFARIIQHVRSQQVNFIFSKSLRSHLLIT